MDEILSKKKTWMRCKDFFSLCRG